MRTERLGYASSYDVVGIGTHIANLVACALLAKRGFRVLLIAQDEPPPTYPSFDGRALPRDVSPTFPIASPVVRRVLGELALRQVLQRHAETADPAFQVALPRHRVDITRDPALLEREIEREFPEVKRPVEDFFRALGRHNQRFDEMLEADIAWPPARFFERREWNRWMSSMPFAGRGPSLDPLAEFPNGHPFRHLVELPARFHDAMDPDRMTGFRLSRLFFTAMLGTTLLGPGMAALETMLIDSVKAHSGEFRRHERVDRILVKRGAVAGVRLAASGEEVGATSVVSGTALNALLPMTPDRSQFEELFERRGEPVVRYYRYVLNALVAADALPPCLGRDVFALAEDQRPLYGARALHLQVGPVEEDVRRLTVGILLPRAMIEDSSESLFGMRGRLLKALGALLPFIERHIHLVDSPHDGGPIQDRRQGQDRAPPEPWARGPRTLQPVYGFPVTHSLGICALPAHTPIRRLFLGSGQVMPGLGLEGHFLAGWSTARRVAGSDRKNEWMRRGRRVNLEI